jgi:acetylornithine deacetylase/succinyl-diaminopimelate desuccinylase-like protein
MRIRLNRDVLGGLFAVLLIFTGLPTPASDLQTQVRNYRAAHEKAILDEFSQMLSQPNVATHVPDIERGAAFISEALSRRGFRTQLLSAGEGTPPAIYGELKSSGARRTVIFYAHYDGQPVGQAGWRSGPWEPVVRAGAGVADSRDVNWRTEAKIDPEWRIYARSASDDKAPIQAMLSALDALRVTGRHPSINVKIFYEGEEEQGSTHLGSILAAHKGLLAGDLFVLSDGPRHQSGRMQVFLGARGATALELTVYGPLRPLHSGHYGNWAPNPAVMLTYLLVSLRDEEGRILIPSFYDDVRPLNASETAALAALPDVEAGLRQELALGRIEGGERLANATARPALNVRGIRIGDVGTSASNTIFPDARASIDFRLVPDETPEGVRARTEEFLRAQGWYVVHEDPSPAVRGAHPKVVKTEWTLGYPGYRASPDSAVVKLVMRSIERTTGAALVRVPMLGASVPMHSFAAALNVPIVGVPLANYDNNQHAANENLRLQNLWDAIEIYAGLLTDLGS